MSRHAPHIMLDIETWGSAPGSSILSIAAVQFFPWHIGHEIGEAFSISVDPKEAGRYGLTIDPGTVVWWMTKVGEDARRLAFDPFDPQTLPVALLALSAWIKDRGVEGQETRIWGHGASFDPVLLTGAYTACILEVPWMFRSIRDTRTVFDMVEDFDVKSYRQKGELEHVPLGDALTQARAVVAAFRLLGLRNAYGVPPGGRAPQLTA